MSYNPIKIALIGMMGCGKSSVAVKLGQKLKIPVFELDRIFEEKNKTTIKDFFKTSGEKSFRIEESKILNSTVNNNQNFILSTGGGVVLSPSNRTILFNNKNIKTIYLSTKSNTIFNRIKNDKNRPLLLVQNPESEIERILNSRKEFYELAEFKIETDDKTIDEIAENIIELLKTKTNKRR